MATWLADYNTMKAQIAPEAAAGSLNLSQAMKYQELLYRIEVLETCQMLCKTAPHTTDMRALSSHYQLVDAYLQCISTERRFGQPADDKQKASRKTAVSVLQKTVMDCRKRFSSFQPINSDIYHQSISQMISTILPVWLQLRDAYISFNK